LGDGWRGDVTMIEFLLSREVDIETTDKFGGTEHRLVGILMILYLC
jgi:hypothetical protein